jgi:hypothetical protein
MLQGPRTRSLFVAEVEVGPPVDAGATALGRRRYVPILGGAFKGERLSGVILPGGADWQLIRADGVAEIAARYVLKVDDGAFLTVTSTGFRHGPAEVMARLAAGEPVDPGAYYFRTSIKFEVDGAAHAWLDRTVCFAIGARKASRVELEFHALL